ncbi:PaaI family thioesterase [Clostridium minihomine]|uniref:PaaI family thioesterase n=1 Tax=Clostridium minihomine TaxID=2045012 RepID=UPI000C765B49|nr:PaaI family thioesterase [Clostridium minihomine]
MLRKDMTPQEFTKSGQGYLPGYLGIELLELEENRMTGRMTIQPFHGAMNGYLHAASVVALADTVCGCAAFAHLPEGAAGFTTVELKSNHLGTVHEGGIFCVATAQHLGNSTQVWDAVVTDEETGKVIELFRCTQMVLWPKKELTEDERVLAAVESGL